MMDLKTIIQAANDLSDDQIPVDQVQSFVNDGIAAINIEAKANFPFLVADTDEPAFPEKWQRMLLIPFTKGRIKEKDSSEFEWESGYSQFYSNLDKFRTEYTIPDEYKDASSSSRSETSILDHRPYGWGGW